MDTLRVIYARSHTLGGLWIRHHDNVAPSRWSHSGAIVDTRGDPFVVESRAFHGVTAAPLADFLERYAATEVVSYLVPDGKAGDDWACAQVGKGYDYLAVFGRLFRQGWEEPTSWHCQELVEGRFVAAGKRRFRAAPAIITPNLGYTVL